MIEAYHGMLTLYDARGEHGVGTDGSQFIYQFIGFLLRDSLFLVFRIRQQASPRYSWENRDAIRSASPFMHLTVLSLAPP